MNGELTMTWPTCFCSSFDSLLSVTGCTGDCVFKNCLWSDMVPLPRGSFPSSKSSVSAADQHWSALAQDTHGLLFPCCNKTPQPKMTYGRIYFGSQLQRQSPSILVGRCFCSRKLYQKAKDHTFNQKAERPNWKWVVHSLFPRYMTENNYILDSPRM